eukprot:7958929-Pyramimonas_sp.AAC.1
MIKRVMVEDVEGCGGVDAEGYSVDAKGSDVDVEGYCAGVRLNPVGMVGTSRAMGYGLGVDATVRALRTSMACAKRGRVGRARLGHMRLP